MFNFWKKKEVDIQVPDDFNDKLKSAYMDISVTGEGIVEIKLDDLIRTDNTLVNANNKNDVLLKEASEIIAEYLKGYSNTPRASKWMNEYNKEK